MTANEHRTQVRDALKEIHENSNAAALWSFAGLAVMAVFAVFAIIGWTELMEIRRMCE